MSEKLPTPELSEPEENSEGNEALYERFQLTVDRGQEPLRIDKFLSNRIEGATRNKLQQATYKKPNRLVLSWQQWQQIS